MSKSLGLIYTAPSIIEPLTKIVVELMPEVERINIMDDNILRLIKKEGKLTPQIFRIVANYVITAEEEGADAVLVTCSSISPCVDGAQALVSVPVLKIDDPMTDTAIEEAERIGVVATLLSTLEPTKNLLLQKARRKSKDIIIKTEVCEGAFEAVSHGDTALHDELVLKGISNLASDVDLIVLAQASMARLLPQLPKEITTPILSSPRSGVEQARKALSV